MSKNLKVQVNAVFKCDLERAFKIPILGDATKFLRGYFVLPAVVAFEDDETWGREGGSRYPIAAKNMFTKGGKTGFDQIYKREENTGTGELRKLKFSCLVSQNLKESYFLQKRKMGFMFNGFIMELAALHL
ncbi:MAG: hypothetical protein ACI857_001837 [Arenicella sp.]|jgi:hypothetical protein